MLTEGWKPFQRTKRWRHDSRLVKSRVRDVLEEGYHSPTAHGNQHANVTLRLTRISVVRMMISNGYGI